MLTQYEYDNISSQKSCYISDTNATVSAVHRYLTTTTTVVSSTRIQNTTPEIKVEPCTKEFLAEHYNEVRIYDSFSYKKIEYKDTILFIIKRHIRCLKILVVNA